MEFSDLLQMIGLGIIYYIPFLIHNQCKEVEKLSISTLDISISEVKKIKPPVKIKKDENPIKKDAIQCLISLGMKKSQASEKVNHMFEMKTYESIESFLLDAYSK